MRHNTHGQFPQTFALRRPWAPPSRSRRSIRSHNMNWKRQVYEEDYGRKWRYLSQRYPYFQNGSFRRPYYKQTRFESNFPLVQASTIVGDPTNIPGVVGRMQPPDPLLPIEAPWSEMVMADPDNWPQFHAKDIGYWDYLS